MNRNAYPTVSAVAFGFVALSHLIRAVAQVPVRMGDQLMPVWLSWVVAAIAGALSVWGFRFCARIANIA